MASPLGSSLAGMRSADRPPEPVARPLDPESAEWVRTLSAIGPEYEAALARLHELLLRICRSELRRRQHGITGPEVDDIAHQAAADALLAVTSKVDRFRGEAQFTTWAFKFAMFEVSNKLGRHFWRDPGVPLDTEAWERLPDRFGLDPARESEWRDLVAALRKAVDEILTEHQRTLLKAILFGVPIDALAAQLGTNRNAIYKTVFDARRKLRAFLVTNGYLGDNDVSRLT